MHFKCVSLTYVFYLFLSSSTTCNAFRDLNSGRTFMFGSSRLQLRSSYRQALNSGRGECPEHIMRKEKATGRNSKTEYHK
jgi:hypothetical protein